MAGAFMLRRVLLSTTSRTSRTSPDMPPIISRADTSSAAFRERAARYAGLCQRLRERLAMVRQGGGETAAQRQRGRGKLLARDRVERLLDPGSPWLELSPLAAWDHYA